MHNQTKKGINQHRRQLWIILIFGLFLAAIVLFVICSMNFGSLAQNVDNKPSVDFARRWLSQTPCAAPCWEGIVPGKTTMADAISLLKSNPEISPSSIKIYSASTTVVWSWRGGDGEDGYLTYDKASKNLINSIRPSFGLELNQQYSLGEVIKVYGEPSYIDAYVCENASHEHISSYAISIFYINSGIEIKTSNSIENKQKYVNSNLLFDKIVFHAVPYQPIERLNLKNWAGYVDLNTYINNRVVSQTTAC